MAYSPTLGRWMQQDPAGYLDGANLYHAYVSNPHGRLDPMGLNAWDEVRATTAQEQQKLRRMLCVMYLADLITKEQGDILNQFINSGIIQAGVPTKGSPYGETTLGGSIIMSTKAMDDPIEGPATFMHEMAHRAILRRHAGIAGNAWTDAMEFFGFDALSLPEAFEEMVRQRLEDIRNKKVAIDCSNGDDTKTVIVNKLRFAYWMCGDKSQTPPFPKGYTPGPARNVE